MTGSPPLCTAGVKGAHGRLGNGLVLSRPQPMSAEATPEGEGRPNDRRSHHNVPDNFHVYATSEDVRRIGRKKGTLDTRGRTRVAPARATIDRRG
jgi:hypothetical protein